MKHNKKTKMPRKVEEGHLEEVKPQKPTKDTRSGKTTKRARKAQNQHSPEIKLLLTLSIQTLPVR
jgi:hypothetical protein